MSYAILEETGETRRVGIAKSGNFILELRVARQEYLLEGDDHPFYFKISKKNEDEEDLWIHLTPYGGVPVRDVEDFKNKVKRHSKRLGIPSVVFNYMRASIELNYIGCGKDFDDPNEYFIRTETEKQKSERKVLDCIYELIKKENPTATCKEINAIFLTVVAEKNGLPTTVLPGTPDYSKLNRKLTADEIRDDIENRRIMNTTSPFGGRSVQDYIMERAFAGR